jgi:poly(3-hydroxybutyrate) depolymerase
MTTTWVGCAHGTQVKLVAVRGGSHAWFSSRFGLARDPIDATRTIVAFITGDGEGTSPSPSPS